jgi:hypothetical protein
MNTFPALFSKLASLAGRRREWDLENTGNEEEKAQDAQVGGYRLFYKTLKTGPGSEGFTVMYFWIS